MINFYLRKRYVLYLKKTETGIAVRDTAEECQKVFNERKDLWLSILKRNNMFGITVNDIEDLRKELDIKPIYFFDNFPFFVFDKAPDQTLVNSVILHMCNKASDWYLPKIMDNIDEFVRRNSINNEDKLNTFISGLIKTRETFKNRRHSWSITDYEFNSILKRIKSEMTIDRGGEK
jgi:hypothetical protein